MAISRKGVTENLKTQKIILAKWEFKAIIYRVCARCVLRY